MSPWFRRKRPEKPKEPKNPAELLKDQFPGCLRLHPEDDPHRSADLETHIETFPKDGMVSYRGREKSFFLKGFPKSLERCMHDLVRTTNAGVLRTKRIWGMEQTQKLVDIVQKLEQKHKVVLSPEIFLRESALGPQDREIQISLHANQVLDSEGKRTPLKKALDVIDELHMRMKGGPPGEDR